ncbi:hypothetical protein KP509_35G018700 [Ceratopteris richardii]|uniref:Wall-associated receptor kinase galacturonan-binding domain-containing protein n=1 Tax=Ceratopteris richardii TaxID=49495 RepID=A0A8T2QFK9_CERRI|nr:hypothetical protein KP509_35G018700 [Ceratopteris richardii]
MVKMVTSVTFTTLIFLLIHSSWMVIAWDCEPSCGGISLNYPFGASSGCGNAAFQSYVNCTHGKLYFYTPTGTYRVQSIDYSNNVMIIVDPHMSTCSSMQTSNAIGLPIGAPFSFATYNKVILLGCSETSSLYGKQSCDTSTEAQEICRSISQNCAGISELGVVAASDSYGTVGSHPSCCVYSSSLLQLAPYEVDLPLLQCTTYTSVYRIGSIQSPQTSWLYGIALQYDPSFSSPQGQYGPYGQNPSCYVCQRAEDSQASARSADWITGLLFLVATAIVAISLA